MTKDEIALPAVEIKDDSTSTAMLLLYREAIYRLQAQIQDLQKRIKILEEN